MRRDCRPYLPPEWAPQSGVQLTWPHRYGDWSERLAAVEPAFTAIAREVACREKAVIVCYDAEHRAHVAATLSAGNVDMAQVVLAVAPSNDTWARDHGPITVMCRNEPLMFDFGFNGWGGKYRHDLDNQISNRLQQAGVFGNTQMQDLDLILEGGSIEVDGSGTLLTTTNCLLAPTRNPKLSRADIERELGELLGVTRVLWLEHGHLEGDDTDSHIDTIARYCDVRTIAYVSCDDPDDVHYATFKEMERELKTFRGADGSPYRLVPLPWPRARFDGVKRLPATYANFLIINNAVLVPTYRDPADGVALTRLKECFPDRKIIGIDCSEVIAQYGSLHCLTMQLPVGVVP
jgi:agmatine deiminase